MRRPSRNRKEDGYRDRDTTIAYDGEQEARHLFLQIAWTDALRKQLGRSRVQCLLLVRMERDIEPGGLARGLSRLSADTPAAIAPAIFL